MKFKYQPQNNPVPMIAYYEEDNEQHFFNLEYKYENFTKDNLHIWTAGAYLIYNTKNEMVSLAYDEMSHLLYLLRILNKDISFEILDKKLFAELKDFFKSELIEIK